MRRTVLTAAAAASLLGLAACNQPVKEAEKTAAAMPPDAGGAPSPAAPNPDTSAVPPAGEATPSTTPPPIQPAT
ncbi:hypothetical protein G3573_12070, partial [Caulobacter sp. 17J65-9]|nr:hypothetical protein [Caulobacter sp. 17J65-9]